MNSVFGRLIVLRPGQQALAVERAPLQATGESQVASEAKLQRLLYDHPEALPIEEIASSFAGLVPVCQELGTSAGPADILYATATGRLAVVEVKLWRNPEARRKVIGQILDYTKALGGMTYEQLDAAVRQARRLEIERGKPAGLVDVVREQHPGLDEAAFVDAVSRSLRKGELLLLIVGDGIREGVAGIVEFLEGHGTLHFTFGLVEVAIYRMPDGTDIVQPRVLAQSEIIRRIVVGLEDGRLSEREDATEEPEDSVNPQQQERARRFEEFWTEFLRELRLDDQSQPLPRPTRKAHLNFHGPQGSNARVCPYLAQSSNSVGVFLAIRQGPTGDRLTESLKEFKADIDRELGVPVEWRDGDHLVHIPRHFTGILLDEHRAEAKKWLADMTNRFITVFRPRIEALFREVV